MTNTPRTEKDDDGDSTLELLHHGDGVFEVTNITDTPADDSVVDWEKEFDEEFTQDGEILVDEHGTETLKWIKSFIHTHIENARREERERIAFMVKIVLSGGNYYLRETLEKLYQALTNKEP